MADSPLSDGDHFFNADSVTFHYRVRGSGPILVAQSVGWGMPGSYLWNGMGPRLERAHTVVYFEPRGNGGSSQPIDEATMTSGTMAEDLEHLRAQLGLESFPALLGHSNGACIALRYAEQHPQRVKKLVLIDAEIQDAPANDSFATWAAKRKDDPVYGAALHMLQGMFVAPPQTDEAFAEGMDKILPWYFSDQRNVEVFRAGMSEEGSRPSVWPFLRQGSQDRQPENRLLHVAEGGKVTARTLVIWGREDAMCSLVAAKAVAGAIKGAKLVLVDGAGHMPWIEKPELFHKEVDMFLDE
ncbi:Alpha/beta-hydrolase [Pleurostoma richardsiae]|uniref:Alpha/beta-hydrolase n=1 Tax=Pleurostoma richardsiae TaxID=41990 RepID=A0AA38RFW2_9PEZI|nr:Alpha/beta-hydrolase [Pleurostoma richardsiae]